MLFTSVRFLGIETQATQQVPHYCSAGLGGTDITPQQTQLKGDKKVGEGLLLQMKEKPIHRKSVNEITLIWVK